MPQRIQQGFDFTAKPEKKRLYEPDKPVLRVWNNNVTEGMKAVIDEGDHMAAILRRVVAGQNTPHTTINNALDTWDNIVLGFEDDKSIQEKE